MPDSGTARTDFQASDFKQLWKTIRSSLALPDETRVFTGHDYQPGSRHPRWKALWPEALNAHFAGKTEDRFVDLRQERDRTTDAKLIYRHCKSIFAAGGSAEDNGRSYLKIARVLPGAVVTPC